MVPVSMEEPETGKGIGAVRGPWRRHTMTQANTQKQGECCNSQHQVLNVLQESRGHEKLDLGPIIGIYFDESSLY